MTMNIQTDVFGKNNIPINGMVGNVRYSFDRNAYSFGDPPLESMTVRLPGSNEWKPATSKEGMEALLSSNAFDNPIYKSAESAAITNMTQDNVGILAGAWPLTTYSFENVPKEYTSALQSAIDNFKNSDYFNNLATNIKANLPSSSFAHGESLSGIKNRLWSYLSGITDVKSISSLNKIAKSGLSNDDLSHLWGWISSPPKTGGGFGDFLKVAVPFFLGGAALLGGTAAAGAGAAATGAGTTAAGTGALNLGAISSGMGATGAGLGAASTGAVTGAAGTGAALGATSGLGAGLSGLGALASGIGATGAPAPVSGDTGYMGGITAPSDAATTLGAGPVSGTTTPGYFGGITPSADASTVLGSGQAAGAASPGYFGGITTTPTTTLGTGSIENAIASGGLSGSLGGSSGLSNLLSTAQQANRAYNIVNKLTGGTPTTQQQQSGLGGLGTGLQNIAGAYLTEQQKQALLDATNRAAAASDPFASQRPQYQQQLATLMANPGAFASSPAYKFPYEQGLQAVNRSLAAKHMTASGNALLALMNYGQGLASQQYFNQANLLSNLAAGGSSPAAAGQNILYGAQAAQGMGSAAGGAAIRGTGQVVNTLLQPSTWQELSNLGSTLGNLYSSGSNLVSDISSWF